MNGSALVLAVDWEFVRDMLAGLFRWAHVFLAIIWIGATAFFWLFEAELRSPEADSAEAANDVQGERYWLHGELFYFRKYGHDAQIPKSVRWHPLWDAYATWITGFALLVLIYYWKADSYLVDPSIADISAATAIVTSVALLVIGWFAYDVLCRILLEREQLLFVILFVGVAATAYGLSHLFTPRGVAIEVGAILGTWLAANSLFVWLPYHRALYKAKAEGAGDLNPRLPALSWQRAKHNAYLAPAVVFAMLVPHFSFVVNADHAWIALVGFMSVGVLLRYFYIWRKRGRVVWFAAGSAVGLFAALVIWLAAENRDTGAMAIPTQAQVVAGKAIFAEEGCGSCHTLAAAGSTSTVGPDLDNARPSRQLVVETVTTGQGAMPAFSGRLSPAEIESVAAYVATVAGQDEP